MKRVYQVVLELPDDDLRFFQGGGIPLEEQLTEMVQRALDDFSSNASDETLDDDGRLRVEFIVRDVTA